MRTYRRAVQLPKIDRGAGIGPALPRSKLGVIATRPIPNGATGENRTLVSCIPSKRIAIVLRRRSWTPGVTLPADSLCLQGRKDVFIKSPSGGLYPEALRPRCPRGRDGDRTRLVTIDNRVPSPESYAPRCQLTASLTRPSSRCWSRHRMMVSRARLVHVHPSPGGRAGVFCSFTQPSSSDPVQYK